jgi:hypothetical protein
MAAAGANQYINANVLNRRRTKCEEETRTWVLREADGRKPETGGRSQRSENIPTSQKLGRRPTVQDRLDFGKHLITAMAETVQQ